VDESRIAFDDRNPMIFGDAKRWEDLKNSHIATAK